MSYTLVQKIKALLLPNIEFGKDKIVVKGEGNQCTIVKKNSYRILDDNFFYGDTNIWKNVWNLKVHERIKNFVWLLVHDQLLTNFHKSLKGLDSAEWVSCGCVFESTLHTFRDCSTIKQLKNNSIPNNIRLNFF